MSGTWKETRNGCIRTLATSVDFRCVGRDRDFRLSRRECAFRPWRGFRSSVARGRRVPRHGRTAHAIKLQRVATRDNTAPTFPDPERRRPRRLASAPASIDTVAAFRPWRGFRSSVARGRRGHHRRCVSSRRSNWRREGDSLGATRLALRAASPCRRLRRLSNPWGFSPPLQRRRRNSRGLDLRYTFKLAERGGFEPPKRGLDAYTLSRRAPSTTRTPLRWTLAGVRAAFGAAILAPRHRPNKVNDGDGRSGRRRGGCSLRLWA